CSALNMGEYLRMLCELGVPVECCASDLYSSGWCLGSVHKMSAKRAMDSCPITDPALDVRDADAVIWRGECLFAMPGDRPSSWCPDTGFPTNTTDARDPGGDVSECCHACGIGGALSCRCALEWSKRAAFVGSHARTGRRLRGPLDRTVGEALLAVATRRCARYPPPPADSFQWFRGTARRGCGAERSHRHLLKKDCEGASVPVAESIDPGRGTHTKDVDLAAPQKHPSSEEKCIRP
ncbi:hypothetical protein TCSYLVIO_010837, partial [Trypanosoma cruzi]